MMDKANNLSTVSQGKENVNLNGLFMHEYYHKINYYHKIIIQYIYLCYSSNDLIKIGESILDYIEFLIKFKLKNKKNSNYHIEHDKKIQEIKKKYFFKTLDWFNLFENYYEHIMENMLLEDGNKN